jgi:hypothetical protein
MGYLKQIDRAHWAELLKPNALLTRLLIIHHPLEDAVSASAAPSARPPHLTRRFDSGPLDDTGNKAARSFLSARALHGRRPCASHHAQRAHTPRMRAVANWPARSGPMPFP